MIAGRIAADDEHEIGVLDVVEHDRRGAGAERRCQPDAARLMAVVAAVVDVVRAVEPSEELQQEARFVASSGR